MSPFKKGAPSRADNTARHANGTPASRSPKHRGYRAEEPSVGRQKARWDAAERRDRAASGERSGRPNWEPRSNDDDRSRGRFPRDDRRGARSSDRDDRGGRSSGRDDRGGRSYDRSDRPQRPNDRDDRGGRSYDRSDRPQRSYDRSDRPQRSYDRDDRGGRSFDRSDRPQRSYDRNDRPQRSFDRNDRNDRPQRSFDRDDRPQRSFDRDDRPQRSFDRDDRPQRSFDRDDRPQRSFDRNDRPQRSFDRNDRPQRSYDRNDRNDRPQRSFDRNDRNDRPQRSFDRNDRSDRPQRSYDRDDRPQRSFDRNDRSDRPQRSFDRDDRTGRTPRAAERSGRHFGDAREDRAAYVPADDVKLEKLQAEATVAADVEGVTFGDLGIGSNIVRVLAELGADRPFPIQAATIPDVLAGKDVLGRGRTGSGKTIAFGAPLVEKLMENGGGKNRRMGRNPRALILAPTRELALQIDRTVQPIARAVGLFTTQIYGGVPQGRQVGALQRGVDIIVGTPGRIEDLMEQGRLDLSEVVVTVLDEADHMCDLGFLEPVRRILQATADVTPTGARAQKLLFSATLDTQVAALVDEFLVEPSVHEVLGEDQASSTIDHQVLVVEQREKDRVIEELASGDGKTVVFARTRAYAERLADQLEDAGIRATSLHGDLNQSRRTRNLSLLTSGRVNVLVATDVAARGIHVDDVSLVIQADLPDECKTYTHRAGRTGRAGKEGTVVTLVTRNRVRKMEGMLERAEIDAPMTPVAPGDALVTELAQR
ncbi:DEAD/DEAH box helicase [Curtobacterium sp. MCBD17_040]|uniref:DEAD/DEAH box helicase n=1 Tax=Curtobacterium sp. MCBD17_040 TaxID=2175674 RepID=UPI0024DF4CE2|nr:DEAD/DEAH box helicase [Curtobacterium sp. MCBD17_040]WIB64207.1 DEAD/DEAH box helicase [Curtobacterium sp. MCBD17_040]